MAFPTARRTLTFISRTILRNSSSTPPTNRFSFSLIQTHLQSLLNPNPIPNQTRLKTSGSGYSPLNDPSPNWTNRPPKETILLDGCDYEHWLIVMEFPDDAKPSNEEMVNTYVKTLAQVVGRFVDVLFTFILLLYLWVLINGYIVVGAVICEAVRRRPRRRFTLLVPLLILALVP